MLITQPQTVSLLQLADLAACARNRIAQIYLHWTAGRYGQVYDDYHLNIDANGTIYRSCTSLTERKSHTWRRNTGSIGIALCGGLGAQANHGYDAELGPYAPTAAQTDKLAQMLALLAVKLDLPIEPGTVMTHCEAALCDGYGPYSGDPVVYARLTRRRHYETGRTGAKRQSPVVSGPLSRAQTCNNKTGNQYKK